MMAKPLLKGKIKVSTHLLAISLLWQQIPSQTVSCKVECLTVSSELDVHNPMLKLRREKDLSRN